MVFSRQKLIIFSLLFAFLLIAVTAPVFADDPEDSLPAPEIDKFPDAQAVILIDDIRYTVNRDGSSSLFEHEIIQLRTAKGLEKYSKIVRSYVLPDQDIKVETARIIKADGTITDLDPQKEIVREAKLAENAPTHKNFIILTLDFSRAEVSDTIEFKLLQTDKRTLIKRGYWSASFIEDEVPMVETRFTVTLRKDADKLRWMVAGLKGEKFQPEIKTLPDGKEYSWILKDRNSIPSEESAPGFRERITHIMITTSSSWEEITKDFSMMFEQVLKPDQKIKSLVAELVNKTDEPREKIAKLANFVRNKKILNLGFTTDGILLVKPAELTDIESLTKFDAHVLFITMLRAAGFEAYPVLSSDLQFGNVNKDFPSPFQFNNLLAAVKTGDDWQYIDVSSQYLKNRRYQYNIEGHDYLVIRPKGGELARVPFSPSDENMELIKSTAILSADGSIGVTMNLQETGSRKVFWDTFLSLLQTPGSETILFSRLTSIVSENAKLLGFTKSDDDAKGLLNMEFSFMVEEYPMVSGNYWIIKLPLLPPQRKDIMEQDPEKRHFPIVLDSKFKEAKSLSLIIPDNFTVKSLPGTIKYSNNVGSLSVNSSFDGSAVQYEYVFKITKTTIPVSEFKDLQELFARAFKAGNEVILLEKSDNLSISREPDPGESPEDVRS